MANHASNDAPGHEALTPSVRTALSEVVDEGKQLAVNHLELRMLEVRGLVEGYANRTFAAGIAMLFASGALICLTVAAIMALAHNGMSSEGACSAVGTAYLVVTALLLRRATSPVHLPTRNKEASE